MQAWCDAARLETTILPLRAGLHALVLAALALIGLLWGQEARAQAAPCTLNAAVTSQLAPAGTVVNFSFQVLPDPCGGGIVTGSIAITADTTGGAVLSATSFTANSGDTVSFTLTLGNTPGGSGTITVTCTPTTPCGAGLSLTFATNNEHVFTANGPTAVVANQITPFTVGANYQLNGAPATLTVNYTNVTDGVDYGDIAPDAAGNTSITQLITGAGPDTIVASVNCPTAFFLEGCPPPAINFAVNVEPVEVTAVSAPSVATTVGVPVNLVARYGSTSIPAPDGTVLAWSVSGQPAGGDGAVTGAAIAGGNGHSAATFTATVPGTYTVLVDSGCGVCVTPQLSFTISVNTVPGLSIVSGDGQNGPIGFAFAAPLVVFADNSGAAAVGVPIAWTVSGDATVAGTSPTDGAGQASATVTAGSTPGSVSVTATRTDSGDSVTFNLTVDGLGSLVIVSGNDQALVPGVASAPLEVELKDAGGAPVAGATINWAVSGGTLASATSVTDAAGIASNTVTADDTGAVEVVASSPLATASATFTLQAGLSALIGLDDRQREIAEVIDNACPALAALPAPTPEQQDLLARCTELIDASIIDPDATVTAIDQLMADVALTQANAAFSALQSQFQNLKTRIAALRSGTQGSSFGGLALTTPSGTLSLGLLAQALAGDDASATEVGADFSRWGFFMAGTIGRGEADPGQVEPAYDYDIEGLTMGLDYRYSDSWIIGGSLGHTRQDTKLPGQAGSLDTTGWTISAYSTWYRADSWYVDGVLTWGRNDYELLRRIRYTLPTPGGGSTSIDQVAVADADGDLLSAAATFGRDFNRGGWGFGPYGRLLYTRIGFDAINEQMLPGVPGSGLGLRIESRDLTSLASVLGGKLTYTHSAAWGVLMPHLQLEWEHEFKDDPQAIEARFLHDPTGSTMLIRGDELDTDYLRIGLGMSMVLTKGRSGFFYYERLMAKDGMSQYNLALGFRMEF
ncbi:autotransporter outer membrane beta-barrel domain-containing protein [Arenimonas fontis]|uniref:Autotransporter domain-containing protein n=1 Tax=Arenimonas fontis TaxID=2608255 RepID=A0A5B2ZEN3_9GAMM|nr:autotransporter outer membrane beta-barrel domain-containing protein [Arenimonas fontis]KAA2285650.1 autotransporter domain-containing protein [Arenimonas fontis]